MEENVWNRIVKHFRLGLKPWEMQTALDKWSVKTNWLGLLQLACQTICTMRYCSTAFYSRGSVFGRFLHHLLFSTPSNVLTFSCDIRSWPQELTDHNGVTSLLAYLAITTLLQIEHLIFIHYWGLELNFKCHGGLEQRKWGSNQLSEVQLNKLPAQTYANHAYMYHIQRHIEMALSRKDISLVIKSQVPGTTRLTGFNETHANMQINIVFFRRNRMFNWFLLSCSSDVAVYAHS